MQTWVGRKGGGHLGKVLNDDNRSDTKLFTEYKCK